MSYPINPEEDEAIERSYLSNGTLASLEDPKIAFFTSCLVSFEGKKLPQGDVRSAASAFDMECMGGGFKNWLFWALKPLNTERYDALHDTINAIRRAGQGARYIQPTDSMRKFDESPMGSALSASADEWPQRRGENRIHFPGRERVLCCPWCPSAINTSETTVVVKDARDEEKEVTARQGQARMALFNVGSKIDLDAGKVTDLAYGVPSTIMEGINAMSYVSRVSQFAQASTRAHSQAKKNDRMSIYSSHACITIMTRATALQILIRNYNTETLESVHDEVQSVDCLAFALQQNRSKIITILIADGNQDNQRNADVPAE